MKKSFLVFLILISNIFLIIASYLVASVFNSGAGDILNYAGWGFIVVEIFLYCTSAILISLVINNLLNRDWARAFNFIEMILIGFVVLYVQFYFFEHREVDFISIFILSFVLGWLVFLILIFLFSYFNPVKSTNIK